MAAHARVEQMNIHDLAQLALSLCFVRSFGDGQTFGTREQTLSLVRRVVLGMIKKLSSSTCGGYPDDAWMVHDLVLLWMDEAEASEFIGDQWAVLDKLVKNLYNRVDDFLRHTPLLRYAQACGSVVQTVHVNEYERAFRELDLRSLGIKYTTQLLAELDLLDLDKLFQEQARLQLRAERSGVLALDPGAGSQNWCLFRFHVAALADEGADEETTAILPFAEELSGIRVGSSGGDAAALQLLDAPFEAHLTAVKLSNDRLNHRKRDAEFRALAHTAGVLRRLHSNADEMMTQRIWWGKRVHGWLQMHLTEVPCLSCLGAMVQFKRRFPKVDLHVSYLGSNGSVGNLGR